jgi:GNAT superfamily N-acetyltransferase
MSLLVRRLGPFDRALLADHLKALAPPDRRLRFLGAVSDVRIEAHVAGIPMHLWIAYGAFVDGCLVGVAEVMLDRLVGARRGEFAVTVLEAWRGRGLARRLSERVFEASRNLGCLSFEVNFAPSNRALVALIRALRVEARFDLLEGRAELALPAPSSVSVATQMALDATGLAAWMVSTSSRRLFGGDQPSRA